MRTISYTILPTARDDIPRILQLNLAAIPAVNSLSRRELLGLFVKSDYFRTMRINGSIVAFLIALAPEKHYSSINYLWFGERYKDFLYIDRIVIDLPHQKKGLGRMFYDDLRVFARNRFLRITCEVNLRPKNEPSLTFHQRYGFHQVGTQETENGTKTVCLMEYSLI